MSPPACQVARCPMYLLLIIAVSAPSIVAGAAFIVWVVDKTRPPDRVDYRLIHQLEYELGFRDDRPDRLVRHGPRAHHALAKDLYMGTYPNPPTDAPGAVIEYDPRRGRPQWRLPTYEERLALIKSNLDRLENL